MNLEKRSEAEVARLTDSLEAQLQGFEEFDKLLRVLQEELDLLPSSEVEE